MKFNLPELGEGVNEGELVKWLVKEGDSVQDDQPICEVMTDKATIEIPSPVTGKVKHLAAKEGDILQVDQLLLEFEVAGEAKEAPEPKPEPKKESQPVPQVQPAAAPQPAPTPQAPQPTQPPMGASASPGGWSSSSGAQPLASPATRKFARKLGVDLSAISGTGDHGRVLKTDVESFARNGGLAAIGGGLVAPGVQQRSFPQGGEKRVPFKGLRRKISEAMRLSKDKAAHFTYVEEADATELVKLRRAAKDIGAQQGIKVTFLPFVMKAMVAALRQFPILNATLDEKTNELVYQHFFNIGLSIQTDDGLTAPVVRSVEHKTVMELAAEIQDLVNRARSKKLTLEDFKGGTITLTNAGSIGGLFATPIINFPEVAILGFNKIFKKPVVRSIGGVDKIVVRDWTYFSISLDHRIVDGGVAAEFMNVFVKYIENPNLLLMESF